MKSRLFSIALIILLLILGGIVAIGLFKYNDLTKAHSEEKVTLIVEQIQKVSKWTAVEGYFSEIYDFNEYRMWDLEPFKKKALLKVNAKVSMGFDLHDWQISLVPETQTIYMTPWGDPEVLSIDHDISYYDVESGIFNRFSEKDYTRMQKRVKAFIKSKVWESGLKEQAYEQRDEFYAFSHNLASIAGWEVIVAEKELWPEKAKLITS